jgi:hypothetical protein
MIKSQTPHVMESLLFQVCVSGSMGSIGYIVNTGHNIEGGMSFLKIEVLVAFPIIMFSFFFRKHVICLVCAVILLVSLWRNHVLRDMLVYIIQL